MSDKLSTISEKTLMPIGFVILIVSFFLWQNAQFAEIRSYVRDIQSQMVQQWSRQDQEIYSLKLSRSNPTLVVPDINEIGVKQSPK